MDWVQVIFFMIATVFILLAGGVWIGVALGVTGSLILILNGYGLAPIATIFWTQTGNFVLVAIPLFILMGELIMNSGISGRFYHSAAPWARFVPGGLYSMNILAGGVFAAVCGSSVATAAAIGKVALPELRKRKCDDSLSFGSVAAGGTLGILIPPSTSLILYGSIVNVNIAELFIAGIIPGLLLIAFFLAWVAFAAYQHERKSPTLAIALERLSLWESLSGIAPILTLIGLIIGGIYAGYVTPTEAAALGVAGALIIGFTVGELDARKVWTASVNSIVTTGMIMFIVLGAQILAYALARTGASREVVTWIVDMGLQPWQVFTLLVILYLILGCFIDAISIMVLTLPLLFPVIIALGFDAVWFGIILTILIEIGLITPPVGLNLFIVQSVSGQKDAFGNVVRGAFPFVIILTMTVVLFYLYPEIVTFLPGLL